MFDRPSNKGNLGTMIRSCDALGADMLIITGHAIFLCMKLQGKEESNRFRGCYLPFGIL